MHKLFQANSRVLHWWSFSACVLIFSAFLHAKLGMDSFWDTLNYHVFLGWSLIELMYGGFGAAAQYQSYLNPLIDGVNYALFTAHPYLGAAFHSVFYLAFAFLIVKIISELIPGNVKISILVVVGCVVSITGAMTVSLFGSWTNENIVAVPILAGLYVLLRGFKQKTLSLFFFAGILFGAAAGLKLTAAHYLVGAFFACIVSKSRLKSAFCLLIGMGVGFFLVDGYFMYVRWSLTENPIFPLANNIFNSPYYSEGWKSFSKFEPSRIFYYLSLPVVWLSSGDFSEVSTVRDGRLLLAYLGIFLIVIDFFISKRADRQKLALVVFFVFSFFAWILAFRVYRYLIVLEALSGVLLVVGFACVFRRASDKRPLLFTIMALPFLWYVTYYPDWGRRPWSESFVTSNIMDLVSADKNALVLFAEQRVSYLAPELDRVGVKFANLYSQPWWDGIRGKSAADSDYSVDPSEFNVADFEHVYFLQYSRFDPRGRSEYLNSAFSDHDYECVEIKTNALWNPYLCQFKEISELPRIDLDIEYDHAAAELFFQHGWSHAEPTHRWSDGEKSVLLFGISENLSCSPFLTIKGFTLGRQFVEVLVDGITVLSTEIEGPFSRLFSLPLSVVDDGRVRLEFLLPTARMPGNGDTRILALGFQSIKINCKQ